MRFSGACEIGKQPRDHEVDRPLIELLMEIAGKPFDQSQFDLGASSCKVGKTCSEWPERNARGEPDREATKSALRSSGGAGHLVIDGVQDRAGRR